ncbi:hypothetical protein [Couchioplanes azureus]|uniref:hypothetical protein n=1 Tax=Couchioplanes caeruleus TaxID=56438 RepID=UPI00167154D3|nr:hypothetical protein [Couchioplanes caeruleus]GGQ70246.1 hypothetical protein GCM10010166_45140 [Couchioplanes caeruleus subsp. azureus]
MAVPNTMKVPVPWEYIAPSGALFLGVEAATDFDKRGTGDDQLRDKETGERVWLVKALDLDPEAGKFGATKEIKVKVVAPVQPVPPAVTVPGYPPMVEFTGVTLTPYVDSQKCKGTTEKCRARLAWSIRATGMTEPQAAGKGAKAAA